MRKKVKPLTIVRETLAHLGSAQESNVSTTSNFYYTCTRVSDGEPCTNKNSQLCPNLPETGDPEAWIAWP